MSLKRPEKKDAEDRNTEIALFRYALIAHLLFDPLSAGQLEGALREISAKTYKIPYSSRTRVGVSTLRRYLQLYNQGGFEALRPLGRLDRRTPRAFPAEVIQKAVALREEQPGRTTPMIVQLLQRDPSLHLDHPLNPHTLTTHLRQLGKTRRLVAQTGRTFTRFERLRPNDLWQGDAMDGPWLPDPLVAGRKKRAYLFCFLDDHSRLIPYAEFFWDEALPRMERVLKVGLLRRGIPKAVYVDNGKVYVAHQFEATCATLGIQLIHASPYAPEGKGKQERFFETVRMQFMPEVAASNLASLSELNESFWAWLECVYHQAVHRETEQTPLERYQQAVQSVCAADPERVAKAFLWREQRTVRKDGHIELQGNTYQVDPRFKGRKLELRFDPFDLSNLELFLDGQSQGKVTVLLQNRQRHLQVERLTEPTPVVSKPASSLDYLALLRTEYQAQLHKSAGSLQFAKLPGQPLSPRKEK